MARTATKNLNLNPNNLKPETYADIEATAQTISHLTATELPQLKIMGIQQTDITLSTPENYEERAYEAILAGNTEEARRNLERHALHKAATNDLMQRAHKTLIARAKNQVIAEDLTTLSTYIQGNAAAAREAFNDHAKKFTAAHHAANDQGDPKHLEAYEQELPFMISGLHLVDNLTKHYGLVIPEHTHPLSVGNFYPSPKATPYTLGRETREAKLRIIDIMEAQARPGQLIRMYWKTPEEFQHEHQELEQLIQTVGATQDNDIKMYEFWLKHEG